MPGVPSCKGCVACSKQKKKCDQAKPACSRCRRLQIPCVGSGVQRFKFVEAAGSGSSSHSTTSLSIRSSVSRSPSNDCTIAIADFTHRLDVKDLRYDLCWSYGEILNEIPKRLGTNAALDASAAALSSAMSGLSVGRMSNETYSKFGQAVKALRLSLADPAFVYTPETLCAIFLIWICQSWFGEADNMVGHGPGIVRILSAANVSKENPDEFEQLLFLTIAGPVAYESIYDSKAHLNPWLKSFVLAKEQAGLAESKSDEEFHGPKRVQRMGFLSCLVHLPAFLQYDPAQQPKVQDAYDSLHTTTQLVEDKYDQAIAAMHSAKTPDTVRGFALYQKSYALYLSFELILVALLHVYDPYNASLSEKSSQLCEQIIELCIQGSVWRPLGSGWITICLASTWVAVTDPAQRPSIDTAWSICWPYGATHSLTDARCLFSNAFDRMRMTAWGSTTTPPPLSSALIEWDSFFDCADFSVREDSCVGSRWLD
ncbi:uncharacterized protein RCC_09209 [Ramularia collo-cygni]|uniref:Zn(2)-C6 fungal-type domain-containing protein n=1 Tax=Ramularia collo-cygni TaxID=112498 RepID=A0A2D3VCP9_9PEZI|nr:uncharacterized protein RCC_09209 [Ramularia collo-cygni]CZT23495.1 uncharacterized protein RCC_09209 [Ramularia collo-cygni]